jgi:L-seryl-tRNA(Ser) seleniumtransferase
MNEIVANAGVRRTEAWEYEAALGAKTAGVLYVFADDSRPALADVVTVAHRHGLPVLVDAAGELPPRSHLRSIVATGADLVAFSGGKALRGPQATGLLCGRRALIAAAALQMLDMDDHPELWDPPTDFIDKTQLPGLPRHGLGRGFKVSKEQIVAALTALRLFSSGAYDAIVSSYRARLETIAAALSQSRCTTRIIDQDDGESYPWLEIRVDEKSLGRSAVEVCRRLRRGQPPIYVGHGRLHEGCLMINPLHLDDAAAQALATRVREELT